MKMCPTITASFAPLLLAAVTFGLGGCDDDDDGLCAGQNCSGHGDCVVEFGVATCYCDPGYDDIGLSCFPSSTDGDGDADADCENDEDCDDELYCNGAEVCDPSSSDADENGCVSGEQVDCDDGNPATDDTCSEELGRCLYDCPDRDGDGHASSACLDEQGDPLGDDCDDDDGNRYPGNLEVCDEEGHDEDCDPETVGDTDEDDDGYVSSSCCNPAGDGDEQSCGPDCDDQNPNVHPDVSELCDVAGVDEDCDGQVNEGLTSLCYPDEDDDGYAAAGTEGQGYCLVEGRGHVAGCPNFTTNIAPDEVGLSIDCDDEQAEINPAAVELCDGLDNDCDGLLAGDPGEEAEFDETDRDHDGYLECAATFFERDCADDDPDAFPGQDEYFNEPVEVVGGFDYDCNGFEELEITEMGGCYPSYDGGFSCNYQPGWIGASEVLCGEERSWATGCARASPSWFIPCFNYDDWSSVERRAACR